MSRQICKSKKYGHHYATCESKILKATDGDYQLKMRLIRGRVSKIEKHNKGNATVA